MGNGSVLFLKNIIADFPDGACIIEVSKERARIAEDSNNTYFALCQVSDVKNSQTWDRYIIAKEKNYNSYLSIMIRHSRLMDISGYINPSPVDNLDYLYNALLWVPQGTFLGNGVAVIRFQSHDGWTIINHEDISYIQLNTGACILNYGDFTSNEIFGHAPKMLYKDSDLNVAVLYFDSHFYQNGMLQDVELLNFLGADKYINLNYERISIIHVSDGLAEDKFNKLSMCIECPEDIYDNVERKIKKICNLNIRELAVYASLRNQGFVIDLSNDRFSLVNDISNCSEATFAAYTRYKRILFDEIINCIPNLDKKRLWLYDLVHTVENSMLRYDVATNMVEQLFMGYYNVVLRNTEDNFTFLFNLTQTIRLFRALLDKDTLSLSKYTNMLKTAINLFVSIGLTSNFMHITTVGDNTGHLCFKFICDTSKSLKEIWNSESEFRDSVRTIFENLNISFEVVENQIDLVSIPTYTMQGRVIEDFDLIGDFDFDNIALQKYLILSDFSNNYVFYDKDSYGKLYDVYGFADIGMDLIFNSDRYKSYMELIEELDLIRVTDDNIFISFIYTYLRQIGYDIKKIYSGIWDKGVVRFIGRYYFLGTHLDIKTLNKYKKYIVSSVVLDFMISGTLKELCGSKQIYYDNFDFRKNETGYYLVYTDEPK